MGTAGGGPWLLVPDSDQPASTIRRFVATIRALHLPFQDSTVLTSLRFTCLSVAAGKRGRLCEALIPSRRTCKNCTLHGHRGRFEWHHLGIRRIDLEGVITCDAEVSSTRNPNDGINKVLQRQYVTVGCEWSTPNAVTEHAGTPRADTTKTTLCTYTRSQPARDHT